MLTLPLEQLKERIVNEKQVSREEVESKIKQKLEELSGLISEEGAAHIVANELGLQLSSGSLNTTLKIGQLNAGMRNVETVGRVVRKFDVRNFQTERGSGKVGSFVLGDESGSVRVALWHAQADHLEKMSEGDVVKIKSGYTRANNFGSLELHLNERSQLSINPEGEKVTSVVQSAPQAPRKSLHDLKENDQNVEVLFTIVDVFDPRFFSICPQCNKRVVESNAVFSCAVHGAVTPSMSYVLNVLGDDGTDTMRVVLWKSQSERLLGLDEKTIVSYKDFPEKFQDVKQKLLGETVKMIGKVNKNTMFDRIEFQAQLVFLNPDPEEELKRLEKQASA